jgi:hypothetical protein|tara:strand:+ start:583 stop:807 length:225 start_codon:yes stop_codon:yes gene_type:complete
MNKLIYAEKRIESLRSEMGKINRVFVGNNEGVFGQGLFIEFENGMNLQLDNKEIEYQAEEYVISEIINICRKHE